MVLPALEYGLDAGGPVHVPVVLPDGSGSAVDHDVDLAEHVPDGPVDVDPGLGERLDALVGDVEAVSFGEGLLGLEVGTGLRHSDELHIVLLADRRCDPLSYRAVPVYRDPDLRHGMYLAVAIADALISVAARPPITLITRARNPVPEGNHIRGTEALLAMLGERGVDTIFGYPGGSVISIYDELLDSDIRHVLVRHEQCAAHMADGYARAGGVPGVCLATSGPGTTNLVTGIATAYADSSPMLALTGQVAAGSLGLGAFQEVDAYSLLMPITKHSYRVLEADRLPHAIDEGWKICQSGRKGPVHIDLPVDQMGMDIDPRLLHEDYGIKPVREDLSGIHEAVQWIREARRPLILVGGGAMDASAEVMEFASAIGAPVATTLMGMGAVPSSYPMNLGPLGLHGRLAAVEMSADADLIISIGSRFSDRTYSPHDRMRSGRVIHIDIDPTEFGKHGHQCVNLQADAAKALRALMCALGSRPVRFDEWCGRAKELKASARINTDMDATPIKPQRVMQEINALLDEDTIVTTDVGQNQMWAMHYLDIEHPRQFITSGTFGTMGFGLPSAIGAKAARPDKKVVTITGDGGLQMVIQELATSVAEDYPVTVVLLNNGVLGMIKQMQKYYWNRRYMAYELGDDPDFVKIAEGYRCDGIRVDRPGEIRDALKTAMESDRTTIVEIMVDPDEDILPMLPNDPRIPIIKGNCGF